MCFFLNTTLKLKVLLSSCSVRDPELKNLLRIRIQVSRQSHCHALGCWGQERVNPSLFFCDCFCSAQRVIYSLENGLISVECSSCWITDGVSFFQHRYSKIQSCTKWLFLSHSILKNLTSKYNIWHNLHYIWLNLGMCTQTSQILY